ncbi:maleylpyruvate isomerase family mycothiol-dependent enzyme [Streptomyces sp. NPDC087420]|uniref:maleylpyruvate isomerase family mycothiol-dependent enzyme n=1 Tax=Streptomyces sp. NPDC087420 TaxID=3365785 RepID=UPI003835134B
MDDWTWLGPPLDVRPLFPVERGALADLLAALEPDEWARPTVCPGWTVRDVAGHILHDYVRRLSAGRDRHPGPEFGSGETLAAFLARTNEDFVRTARQISPRLLIDLLAHLGAQLDVEWSGREMGGPAGVDVAWAAPGREAPAWLDIAREYSELWVHQQQIRDAVGRPGATAPRLLHPVLDTFLRALPQTLHRTPAPVATTVRVRVPGPAGGRWTAVRRADRWTLDHDAPAPAAGADAEAEVDAEVVIGADTLWRLATRGITVRTAHDRATTRGDTTLSDAALDIVSIVWEPSPEQP